LSKQDCFCSCESLKKSGLHKTVTKVFLAPALALLLWPLAARVQADELPKFSDAKVNEFVSQYADFVTKYIQAYQAAKAGNPSAFNQLKTQVKQLQDEVAEVAKKLESKPEEVQRYELFITTYTEKMIDGTK
jgi:hypothetical protein